MHHWCPWSCGLGPGTAPEGEDGARKLQIMHFTCEKKLQGFERLNLGSTLPSTSWKCSQNSSDPHSRNHPSWMSLHTGRRPGTYPSHKEMKMRVKQPAVEHLCWPAMIWYGLPSAYGLHPHLHPISGWETAASCWWSLRQRRWSELGIPAKKGEKHLHLFTSAAACLICTLSCKT